MHKDTAFFKGVKAYPNHLLEVDMGTQMCIIFDFKSKLKAIRYGCLKDESLFQNVFTDGNYLIFGNEDYLSLKISAKEFMDLVFENAEDKSAIFESVIHYEKNKF